jgi:hypothetical protein
MSRRDLLAVLALAFVAIAVAFAQRLTGVDADVLIAAPALLLLLPLVAGRYVGEGGLSRLVRELPRRRYPSAAPAVRRSRPHAVPRGGLLIAVALARRGPPGRLLAR